jgi:serine/threonine-protein kinase
LNGSLSEAHLDLAIAFTYDFDWTNAYREFAKALELEPGNVAIHHAYSGYLAKMGRLEEALAEHRICLDLDPISASSADWVARSLYHQRQFDDAIAGFRNALALSVNHGPSHQGLGMAYLAKGMYAQGLQETILARQLMEGDTLTSAQLGYGYAISGRTADARRLLAELLERSERNTVPAIALAYIYIGLRENDNALKWLGKAIDEHYQLYLLADPIYDPLRKDVRFAELLQRMKLKPVS